MITGTPRGRTLPRVDRGDILGGTTAALIAIPGSIALSTLIFVPFGPAYFSLGLLACIIPLFIGNLIATIGGGSSVLITATNALTAVLWAGVAREAMTATTATLGAPDPQAAWVAFFAIVAVSGVMQILLGALGVGQVIRYVPMPLLAGLRNGAAVVILLTQVRPFLGIADGAPLDLASLRAIDAAIPIVAATTTLLMWHGNRVVRWVPAPILAVAAGTALFAVFERNGWVSQTAATIGTLPDRLFQTKLAEEIWRQLQDPATRGVVAGLFPLAASIAAIDVLQTLITIAVADNLTDERTDPKKEILGQGLANLVSGLVGGVSGAGLLTFTLSNHANGGRTRASRWVAGGCALAVVLCFAGYISIVPQIVLAGLLVGLSLLLADGESIRQSLDFVAGRIDRGRHVGDVFIVVVTVASLVWLGPMTASAIGLVLAVAHVVIHLAAREVLREVPGDELPTVQYRDPRDRAALASARTHAVLFVLRGDLFFGSCAQLNEAIERCVQRGARAIALDFEAVSLVDTTTVSALRRAEATCRRAQVLLVFAVGARNGEVEAAVAHLTAPRFARVTDAIGHIDDVLLDRLSGPERHATLVAAAEIEVLGELTERARDTVTAHCEPTEYSAGSHPEPEGSAMYFVQTGRLRAFEAGPDGGRHCVASIGPGGTWGAEVLFRAERRPVTLRVEGAVRCLRLTTHGLDELRRAHPQVAAALVDLLVRQLISRRPGGAGAAEDQ
jgi:SulP family sulfate permease